MIAQLISWFLAFAAVCLFGIMVGVEIGSKKGWHRGRRALLREQAGGDTSELERQVMRQGYDVLNPAMAKTTEPTVYDRESE